MLSSSFSSNMSSNISVFSCHVNKFDCVSFVVPSFTPVPRTVIPKSVFVHLSKVLAEVVVLQHYYVLVLPVAVQCFQSKILDHRSVRTSITVECIIKAPLGACLAPAARVHVRTYAAVRRVGSGKRGDISVCVSVCHSPCPT